MPTAQVEYVASVLLFCHFEYTFGEPCHYVTQSLSALPRIGIANLIKESHVSQLYLHLRTSLVFDN